MAVSGRYQTGDPLRTRSYDYLAIVSRCREETQRRTSTLLLERKKAEAAKPRRPEEEGGLLPLRDKAKVTLFDREEWLLNRHRKRSAELLGLSKRAEDDEKKPPKEPAVATKPRGFKSIDSFGEVVRKSGAARSKVSRSSSSAADCGAASSRRSKVAWRDETSPKSCSGGGCSNNNSHRRKSDASHLERDSFKWLEVPEDVAPLTDMLVMERWIDLMREFRSADPLHGFSQVKDLQKEQPVLRKGCDPHGCTFEFDYEGETDELGRPHGEGTIFYRNGDRYKGAVRRGRRHGLGILFYKTGSNSDGARFLEGEYVDNVLNGSGSVAFANGDVLYCAFVDGFLHGPSKLFSGENVAKQVGWYRKGVLSGLVWKFLVGGGFLVGLPDITGSLTGDNIAFLYPDMRTALCGTFVKGKVTIAQTCFVKGVTHRRIDGMLHLSLTEPRGPLYSFDAGKGNRMCDEPLLPDPFEFQTVVVRASKIKGGGEGMFAKRSLKANTVVSFYNGIRLSSADLDEESKDDWEANAYKIMDLLGPDDDGREGIIDVPPEYTCTRKYCASLAHKTNHSFHPNGNFSLADHPRFGLVPGILLTEDVAEGEEITVSYDYAIDDAPPWYQDLFTRRIMDSYRKTLSYNF